MKPACTTDPAHGESVCKSLCLKCYRADRARAARGGKPTQVEVNDAGPPHMTDLQTGLIIVHTHQANRGSRVKIQRLDFNKDEVHGIDQSAKYRSWRLADVRVDVDQNWRIGKGERSGGSDDGDS